MNNFKQIEEIHLRQTNSDKLQETYKPVYLDFDEIITQQEITNYQFVLLLQPTNLYYIQDYDVKMISIWNMLSIEQKMAFYRSASSLISNPDCFFYITNNIVETGIDNLNYNIAKNLYRFENDIKTDDSFKDFARNIIMHIITQEPEILPISEYDRIIIRLFNKEFTNDIQKLIILSYDLRNYKRIVKLLRIRNLLSADIFEFDDIIFNLLMNKLSSNTQESYIINLFNFIIKKLPVEFLTRNILNNHNHVEDLLLIYLYSEPIAQMKRLIEQIVYLHLKYFSLKYITLEEVVEFYKKVFQTIDSEEYNNIFEIMIILKSQELILEIFPSFESLKTFTEMIDCEEPENIDMLKKIEKIKEIMNVKE